MQITQYWHPNNPSGMHSGSSCTLVFCHNSTASCLKLSCCSICTATRGQLPYIHVHDSTMHTIPQDFCTRAWLDALHERSGSPAVTVQGTCVNSSGDRRTLCAPLLPITSAAAPRLQAMHVLAERQLSALYVIVILLYPPNRCHSCLRQ